jgi:hypothetical protein
MEQAVSRILAPLVAEAHSRFLAVADAEARGQGLR